MRAELRALGYLVRDEPFAFSAFAGVLGAPVLGLASAAAIAASCALAMAGDPGAGLATLTAGGLVIAGLGRWLARRAVLSMGWMRRTGLNMFATRGDAIPRVWLVAHLDAKWQPVPTGVRTAGVIVLAAAGAGAVLALLADLGMDMAAPYTWIMALAVVGAIPLAMSYVGRGGMGALDNASGVATVLEAARLIGDDPAIGVAITDAEELALAGARAWAASDPPSIALNCDGVDDHGGLVLMTVPTSSRLVEPFRSAAGNLRVIRLIPGVLTDSVAFADAGWETVTLSHGTWRTLGRIHTSADNLDHLHGTGIAPAAHLLATVAVEIAQWKS